MDYSHRLVDHSDNEFMVASFAKSAVLHVSQAPVVITLVGRAGECVVGQMLDFAKEMQLMVGDISKTCIRE